MNGREVIGAIALGELDSDLTAIKHAAVERQKIVGRNAMRSMKAGDRVRLVDDISPKGLAGATGTVKRIKQTRADVVIDKEFAGVAGRFAPTIHTGGFITVPSSLIAEVIE